MCRSIICTLPICSYPTSHTNAEAVIQCKLYEHRCAVHYNRALIVILVGTPRLGRMKLPGIILAIVLACSGSDEPHAFISFSSLHHKTKTHGTNFVDKENRDYVKLRRNQEGRKYISTHDISAQTLNGFVTYTASVQLCILRFADRIPVLHILTHQCAKSTIYVREVPRCRSRDMVVGTELTMRAERSGVRITAGARYFSLQRP